MLPDNTSIVGRNDMMEHSNRLPPCLLNSVPDTSYFCGFLTGMKSYFFKNDHNFYFFIILYYFLPFPGLTKNAGVDGV